MINRDDACKTLFNDCHIKIMSGNNWIRLEEAIARLTELPDADPERKKGEWQYDEDNGNVMCRCPQCLRRMLIGLYQYKNPYKFCPYCGQALAEGKLTENRKQVYGK